MMVKSRGRTLGFMAGLVALCATPALAQVQINIGSAAPDGSGKAAIPISVVTGGAMVGGMQNDILFDNTIVKLNSKTDCKINADIGTVPDGCNQDPVVGPCKTLSGDLKQCGASPQPAGCPAGSGTNISRFRAILAATAVLNTNPIPDGVLYTCNFTVVDATKLPATLQNMNVIVSDNSNPPVQLPKVGNDGAVTGGGGEATATPTTGVVEATPTPTTEVGPPTATPTGIRIIIGEATPDGTGKAPVPISLITSGAMVGGMQNDILFDNTIVKLNSKTDCKINADIGTVPDGCNQDPVVGPCKTLSGDLKQCGASPQPAGCPAGSGTNISRFRAILAATAVLNTNPIPDGVLYTCTFTVVDGTKLPAALQNTNVIVSDNSNPPVQLAHTSSDGTVNPVQVEGTPTNTPEGGVTPTNTPIPPTVVATNTPTTSVVNTSTPTVKLATATATKAAATATPTATPTTGGGGGGGFEEEGGCQIGARGGSAGAWLLIVPAIGLLVMRRRSR